MTWVWLLALPARAHRLWELPSAWVSLSPGAVAVSADRPGYLWGAAVGSFTPFGPAGAVLAAQVENSPGGRGFTTFDAEGRLGVVAGPLFPYAVAVGGVGLPLAPHGGLGVGLDACWGVLIVGGQGRVDRMGGRTTVMAEVSLGFGFPM